VTSSIQLISVSRLGAFAPLLHLHCSVIFFACAALLCWFTVPFLCICIAFVLYLFSSAGFTIALVRLNQKLNKHPLNLMNYYSCNWPCGSCTTTLII